MTPGLSPENRDTNVQPAVAARLEDQDRTLRALHQLERAASGPVRHAGSAWFEDVLRALSAMQAAMDDERANADRPESLLSNIARTNPRLRSRAHGSRAQLQQLCETVAALHRDVETSGPTDVDHADFRRRVARLGSALRYQRARESDLIYEAIGDEGR
jgi:hypothetical protein